MNTKKKTKRAAFCCPHHGAISNTVDYFSVDMGSKRLIDIPVMYCESCKKYYTPFANLLALVGSEHAKYKGYQVAAGRGRAEKSFPKIEVRTPYFVDAKERNRQKEHLLLKQEKTQKKQEILRKEKNKQYIESLREVPHYTLTLTNKPCFVKEHICPRCKQDTRKEHVKIVQYRKSLLAHVRHCERCDADFITPKQFCSIDEKASQKIYGDISYPFVRPKNIECEYQEGRYLFIPYSAIDSDRFSQYHLPPRNDEYYDMTDEEYLWVKTFYQPEEFTVPLRQKSFLGEAGYSTSESEIRRHNILARCVNEYGKNKVINQLKTNMNLRMKQKDGNIRYSKAINVWRGDIWYIENQL